MCCSSLIKNDAGELRMKKIVTVFATVCKKLLITAK